MDMVVVKARDIPEAWWMLLKECLQKGYEYKITRGSFEGQKRKDLDWLYRNRPADRYVRWCPMFPRE